MTDEAFEAKLRETMAKIEALPAPRRGPLMRLLEQTRDRHAEICHSIHRAQEVLDDWRLHQKYVQFDLEASLREARGNRPPNIEPGKP